jgi:hypothetical protein
MKRLVKVVIREFLLSEADIEHSSPVAFARRAIIRREHQLPSKIRPFGD